MLPRLPEDCAIEVRVILALLRFQIFTERTTVAARGKIGLIARETDDEVGQTSQVSVRVFDDDGMTGITGRPSPAADDPVRSRGLGGWGSRAQRPKMTTKFSSECRAAGPATNVNWKRRARCRNSAFLSAHCLLPLICDLRYTERSFSWPADSLGNRLADYSLWLADSAIARHPTRYLRLAIWNALDTKAIVSSPSCPKDAFSYIISLSSFISDHPSRTWKAARSRTGCRRHQIPWFPHRQPSLLKITAKPIQPACERCPRPTS